MTQGNTDSALLSRGKLGTRIAAAVIVIGASVVLVTAFQIGSRGGFGPQKPGFFPIIVGVGLVVFGLAFLVRTTVKPDYSLREQADEGHAETRWRTLWTVIVCLVIYAVILKPLGYVLATVLFFFAVAWIGGSRQWIRDIIVAVLFSVIIYLGFTELLGVRLPAGLLEGVG